MTTNLIGLECKIDVKETLEEFNKKADDFEAIIIVGLKKDGSQLLETSSCSAYKKFFLLAFANSWMNNWFRQTE